MGSLLGLAPGELPTPGFAHHSILCRGGCTFAGPPAPPPPLCLPKELLPRSPGAGRDHGSFGGHMPPHGGRASRWGDAPPAQGRGAPPKMRGSVPGPRWHMPCGPRAACERLSPPRELLLPPRARECVRVPGAERGSGGVVVGAYPETSEILDCSSVKAYGTHGTRSQ